MANLNLSNPRWTQNIIQNCHTLKVLDLGYCTGRACYKIKSWQGFCKEFQSTGATYKKSQNITNLDIPAFKNNIHKA